MARALVGIGSNLGDRLQQLNRAVELVTQSAGTQVLAISPWHETAPIGGPPGQHPFLNGALLLETSLDPAQLWQKLSKIENVLGRQREVRWQARSLDLDILLYDDLILSTPELTIPHPRMAFRRFVLAPAVEVAPNMLHPQSGWTLEQLINHLQTAQPYVAISGAPALGKSWLAEKLAAEFDGKCLSRPHSVASDSSSPALGREIELLRTEASLLAKDTWPTDGKLRTTDFWFDQSLAYGQLNLSNEQFAELQLQYGTLAANVMTPKLLVLLTGAATVCDDPQAIQLEHSLIELARRRGIGPVLEINASDRSTVWQEARAAIEAMK